MKRAVVVLVLALGMVLAPTAALADPIEIGCDRDIVVRIYRVACVGVDYP